MFGPRKSIDPGVHDGHRLAKTLSWPPPKTVALLAVPVVRRPLGNPDAPREVDPDRLVAEPGRGEEVHQHRPVVGDLGRADLHQRAAGRRLQVGQRRQLPRRAVHRVLDDVTVIDLLHAAARERQQFGKRHLGVGPAHPDRQADHEP